eukprot:CAMPEP_0115039462 /NCGR_PEP_ID=MMETSP0216-20121206/44039_1 /TAXON_ID=223996 /ORGANISM="Protocruzia adherens, Strain Boccale" /LENGTH=232 /DNA_ID=CAMNT_0002420099 /DNA_START=179 /DNA_END=873 /DNA_ORIENTATION=+
MELSFDFPKDKDFTGFTANSGKKEVSTYLDITKNVEENDNNTGSQGKVKHVAFAQPSVKGESNRLKMGKLGPRMDIELKFHFTTKCARTSKGFEIRFPPCLQKRKRNFALPSDGHIKTSLSVMISSPVKIDALHSAFPHSIEYQKDRLSASLCFGDKKLNDQFLITWTHRAMEIPTLSLEKHEDYESYAAMVNCMPKLDYLQEDFSRGEFIFILDRSFSMHGGGKMTLAKEA